MIVKCPFFAMAWITYLRVIIENSPGNRCALVTDAHSPCIMLPALPAMMECPRVAETMFTIDDLAGTRVYQPSFPDQPPLFLAEWLIQGSEERTVSFD